MKLYALCDQDLLDKNDLCLEDFVAIAKKHDAEVIQYRNKSADISFIKQQLIELRRLFEGFLIINDTFELSPFCDGVHIGQEDLQKIDPDEKKAIKILREVLGKDKLIGLSTHNKDEIIKANELDINYVGLGAYRATSTKEVDNILADRLDEIASFSIHPVAAIGGVRLDDRFENVTYHVIGSGLL
ncbi:thiamine phosphate synthase [Sulfurimonas sp. HSL-1716]|uniref:thiamine phosphate synthase n=1 Tax=Hydrocurvibacter sulfurireducens TaxID=3131937 RepID=UPI0031F86595